MLFPESPTTVSADAAEVPRCAACGGSLGPRLVAVDYLGRTLGPVGNHPVNLCHRCAALELEAPNLLPEST
jgi:hypothetical protein